jgi:hypothetical protein
MPALKLRGDLELSAHPGVRRTKNNYIDQCVCATAATTEVGLPLSATIVPLVSA